MHIRVPRPASRFRSPHHFSTRRAPRPASTRGMSYLLPHLKNGWAVDQAILSEDDRVVVIRFGSDADDTCMRMDEVCAKSSERRGDD